MTATNQNAQFIRKNLDRICSISDGKFEMVIFPIAYNLIISEALERFPECKRDRRNLGSLFSEMREKETLPFIREFLSSYQGNVGDFNIVGTLDFKVHRESTFNY